MRKYFSRVGLPVVMLAASLLFVHFRVFGQGSNSSDTIFGTWKMDQAKSFSHRADEEPTFTTQHMRILTQEGDGRAQRLAGRSGYLDRHRFIFGFVVAEVHTRCTPLAQPAEYAIWTEPTRACQTLDGRNQHPYRSRQRRKCEIFANNRMAWTNHRLHEHAAAP